MHDSAAQRAELASVLTVPLLQVVYRGIFLASAGVQWTATGCARPARLANLSDSQQVAAFAAPLCQTK